jgi:hypothetical protein
MQQQTRTRRKGEEEEEEGANLLILSIHLFNVLLFNHLLLSSSRTTTANTPHQTPLVILNTAPGVPTVAHHGPDMSLAGPRAHLDEAGVAAAPDGAGCRAGFGDFVGGGLRVGGEVCGRC